MPEPTKRPRGRPRKVPADETPAGASATTPRPGVPTVGNKDWTANRAELYRELSRPFPVEEVQFRPAARKEGTQKVLVHIDARAVLNRLDSLLPLDYEVRYETVGNGMLEAHLSLLGAVKSGLASLDNKFDEDFDRAASAGSMALKRAAVQVGVGRYLYETPEMWGEVVLFGDEFLLPLDELNRVRQEYQEWMQEPEVMARWGEPLPSGARPPLDKRAELAQVGLDYALVLDGLDVVETAELSVALGDAESSLARFLKPKMAKIPLRIDVAEDLETALGKVRQIAPGILGAGTISDLKQAGNEINDEADLVKTLLRPVYENKMKALRQAEKETSHGETTGPRILDSAA